ncbi:DoxX family protein [Tessaracoccus sp. Z1128]
MSNNDWVQQGTPRDEEWTAEEDDYGVPVEPAEWDDYSSEQTVPVPPAPSQPAAEARPPEESGGGPSAEPPVDDASPEPAIDEPAGDQWAETGVHDAEAPAADAGEAEVHGEDHAEGQPVEDAPEWDEAAPAPEAGKPEPEAEPVAESEPQPASFGHPAEPFGWPADAEPAGHTDQQDTPSPESPEESGSGDGVEDPDATRAMPVVAGGGAGQETAAAAGAAGGAAGAAALAGLYRADRAGADDTQVIEGAGRRTVDDEVAEEERLAHQLRAEKEARDQRLGLVQTSDANSVRDPRPLRRKGVGGFGSFGLFVLRLVTAAVLGVVGYQVLSDIDATAEFLGRTLIPEPRLVAWILGFGLAALAVLLVIGLAVRVVGLLLAFVAVGALAFIRWGQFSPFIDGMEGFLGDKDLLLFGVGVLFLSLGGGRWGIDGAFSKARENAREAKH